MSAARGMVITDRQLCRRWGYLSQPKAQLASISIPTSTGLVTQLRNGDNSTKGFPVQATEIGVVSAIDVGGCGLS